MLDEPKAPDVNAELTDAQLEQAAGGRRVTVIIKDTAKNRAICAQRNIPVKDVTFSTFKAAAAYILTLRSAGLTCDVETDF